MVYDVFIELSVDLVLDSDTGGDFHLALNADPRKSVAALRTDETTVDEVRHLATVIDLHRSASDFAADITVDLVERLERMPVEQRTALLLGYLGGYSATQNASIRTPRSPMGSTA